MLRCFLLLAVAGSLSSCHVGRFFVYNFANITDHKIFPATEMPASTNPQPFAVGPDSTAALARIKTNGKKGMVPLTDYLDKDTRTTAFLVIREDSILFERYYEGYTAGDISTFFSVSKSITSLLVGIAVDEGLIESIDDPVTKYIPELRDADPLFQKQTIRHLLQMRSGLQYTESYSNPFAPMAKLYYGCDQLGQIEKMSFREEPGTKHRYQSVSTAILGIVIEKVTGEDLGRFLAKKVWEPLGMEYAASFSLDDKKHRSAKAYSGVNATARDLAKIGRLYLNGGVAPDGTRIVSADWVEQTLTPDFDNDFYQYQWYAKEGRIREKGKTRYFPDQAAAETAAADLGYQAQVVPSQQKPGQYYVNYASGDIYAQGILNQHLYLVPEDNIIIVRLGKKYDDGYLWMFPYVRDAVKRPAAEENAVKR